MHYLFNADGSVNHDMVIVVARESVTRGRKAWQCNGRGSYLTYDSALAVALRDLWLIIEEYKINRPKLYERKKLPVGFGWYEPKRSRGIVANFEDTSKSACSG